MAQILNCSSVYLLVGEIVKQILQIIVLYLL